MPLLAVAAELVEDDAQCAVGNVGEVAGQQFVRQPAAGGNALVLLAGEIAVAGAGVWRFAELDRFAGQQFLHRARFERGHRRAVVVGLDRQAGERVECGIGAGRRTFEEAGEKVGELLAFEDSIIEVADPAQAGQDRREFGDAAQLAWTARLEDMQHELGRHADG